jgi:hypothetical protein
MRGCDILSGLDRQFPGQTEYNYEALDLVNRSAYLNPGPSTCEARVPFTQQRRLARTKCESLPLKPIILYEPNCLQWHQFGQTNTLHCHASE